MERHVKQTNHYWGGERRRENIHRRCNGVPIKCPSKGSVARQRRSYARMMKRTRSRLRPAAITRPLDRSLASIVACDRRTERVVVTDDLIQVVRK